jgi:hypothetical protein
MGSLKVDDGTWKVVRLVEHEPAYLGQGCGIIIIDSAS